MKTLTTALTGVQPLGREKGLDVKSERIASRRASSGPALLLARMVDGVDAVNASPLSLPVRVSPETKSVTRQKYLSNKREAQPVRYLAQARRLQHIIQPSASCPGGRLLPHRVLGGGHLSLETNESHWPSISQLSFPTPIFIPNQLVRKRRLFECHNNHKKRVRY